MRRGRFSGGLLGFIDGIKSGKDVVELCTEMSKSEAGIAGLNALAALLGIGTAASLAPAALPLTVGAVSVTAAVKFYLWWQNELEKKTESAKLTDVQAILRTWQGSASGGWDRLDEKYGPLDPSVKQNVVGFIESLLRYELGEVKESIDAVTTHQEVRFQQMAEQMAEYQRQNNLVFASLKKSLDESFGNSLVELFAGADASVNVKAELASSIGSKLRTLLEMPVMVEAGLKRIEDALKPRVLLHNPRPSKNLTDLNRLRFEQRWTKLVGVDKPLQELRNFCSGEDFSWLILTAPGGCGKSRLAQELCDELWLTGWNSGFYDGVKNLDSWRELNPDRPTLIVVDYLWSKLEDWPERIKALNEYLGNYPIRLLILERPADVSAWNGLIDDCPEAFETYVGPKPEPYKIDALELPGLNSDDDVWSIMCQVWGDLPPVKFEQVFQGDLQGYRRLDPFGRPLLAILVAIGLQGSDLGKFQWNLDLVTQGIIRRIIAGWKKAGVKDDHIRLLLLATLSDGLDLTEQPELHGLPQKGCWNEKQCRVIVAYTDEFNPKKPAIPAFRPDPLGEAFVLHCLSGTQLCDEEGNTKARKEKVFEIFRHCAKNYSPQLTDFVRRTISDYPNSLQELVQAAQDIEGLNLSGLELTSLPDLKGWVKLTAIDLKNNRLSNIESLASFTNVQDLDLRRNRLSDIDPLKKLLKLSTLKLSINEISDVTPLQKLHSLNVLNIGTNNLIDIAPLADLSNLEILDLSDNEITSVEALRDLKNLSDLNMFRNRISNIQALGHLSGLLRLNISSNPIHDFSPVGKLSSLSELSICDARHLNIEFFRDLPSLTYLELNRSIVPNLAPLKHLEKIKLLHLQQLQFSSIEPLAKCFQLTILDLEKNSIRDISPLAGLLQLETLYLGKNMIQDLRPLFGLKNLGYIDLVGNADLDQSHVSELKSHLPGCLINF